MERVADRFAADLADLIRRTLLPVNEITIKIAAIEHRSSFSIFNDEGGYMGMELGADIAADLNLDDFLVFENDYSKSVGFFESLLFKHYQGADGSPVVFEDAAKFIQALFTQRSVFEEFVRAVEGVPRDALNLASKVATRGYGKPFSMDHVRGAARDWYNQDKAAAIRGNEGLNDFLVKVVDKVIGDRRARAFMFPSNERHPFIEQLFDSRSC